LHSDFGFDRHLISSTMIFGLCKVMVPPERVYPF
jgi:hypothetical protein